MGIVEQVGLTLNGWVAALGGIAVIFVISAFLGAYHALYVRRVLWKIYGEVRRTREVTEKKRGVRRG